MEAVQIINTIEQLPVLQRMFIIEKVIHSIREEGHEMSMGKAADYLLEDYKNNKDLTAFTSLDYEDFYY